MSNMAVQMNYGEPSRGMPGGLYDRAEYEAVTRRNSAEDKALCFGYGVVQGAEPGKDIALPATGATADKFEGVVMYSANVEIRYGHSRWMGVRNAPQKRFWPARCA